MRELTNKEYRELIKKYGKNAVDGITEVMGQGKTMELKDVLETYISMVGYSYQGVIFVDMYEKLCNFINSKRDKYDSFVFKYDWNKEMHLITWSFIIGLYGDYGTSPRSGWIYTKRAEELKSDLKWVLEDSFFGGYHGKIKDDQKFIKIIRELQDAESLEDKEEILVREGIF